jgi:outer membrane lipase/esterase
MTNRRLIGHALLGATALAAASIAAPAAAQHIDNIIAFGDSYPDFGIARTTIINDPAANPAFQALVTQIYPTGRFSGSTNYIDTLSDILDVPVANFAVGGALTRTFPGGSNNTNCTPALGNQPSPATCPLGFAYEVDQFLNVGVQSPLFPGGAAVFDEGDLVTISAGGNDARFYQVTGGSLANAASEAALSVAGATTQLDRLVAAGAPNISFLAGDTSRLPEVIGNTAAQQVRATYSSAFNTGIQGTLAGYAANGVMVHYLDLNRVLDNVIANPAAYGITQGSAASLYTCPSPTPTAPVCLVNSTGYLFYFDGLHLTSTGFDIVARYIATQLQAPLTLEAPSELGLDTVRQFGRTLSSRVEGVKLFLVGDTFSRDVKANASSDQFDLDGVGVTAGLEYGFGTGTVGIAGNYSRPRAKFIGNVSRDEADSFQVGGFGGFAIAGAFAQGYLGYGWDDHDIERKGVVEGMSAKADGDHWLAGAKAGYLMPVGIMRAGPVVAIDYAKAKVDGYTEGGDPALTLNVDSVTAKSLTGGIGGELRGDFDTNGVSVRPYLSAMLEKELGDNDRVVRFAQTTSPGIVNSWSIGDRSKKAYGRLSAGGSAEILSRVSLNTVLSTTVSRDDGNEVSAQVGLNVGF